MKSLIGALVGAIVLTLAIATVAYSQDRKLESKDKLFADGAILVITTSGVNNSAIYFEDPELKKIGETWFLVGKYATVPGFPSPSKTLSVWVAMSSITMIHEYKDAEELRKTFPAQAQPAP